jgi:prepilin-type N-terminal cleavage/methylation domain-containing protein
VTCAVRDRTVIIFIEGFVMSSRGLVRNATLGFTIVELMVVLVIAAALVMAAAPSITQTMSNQRAQSAAYELAQVIQTARSQAILSRREVDLRATYPSPASNIWNGTKTGTPVTTDITTADKARISQTSYYILETGTMLSNSTAGITDNRVTSISKLNDNVVINPLNAIALIRFTPDSTVQVSTGVGTAPTTLNADQTFLVTDTGNPGSAGYTVTLTRFGGSKVQKN